ncbi:MAG TPA: cytochrome d ubiquinol oxidase subunit II [Ktedonobacteraceae bacterium]|nr:cytochrome d ubiquinol oxidase subunit II [Ktedonobacteraceae bacterium]
MTLAYVILTILWLSLIAYAVLGGADFGAGFWDLLYIGNKDVSKRRHEFINHALGPVWEANHVWLIFLIVGLFTAFPSVFSTLSIVLFLPFTLALIGIVLRGAAFIFRVYGTRSDKYGAIVWGTVFSFASIITPFILGASAAAVASGRIRVTSAPVQADMTGSTWLTPFAIVVGLMAIALCAVLSSVYLSVEAKQAQDKELEDMFRLRAIIAGAVTAVLGALGLYLSTSEDPLLWQGLLGHAIPVVIATMVVGLATAAALFMRHYRIARVLVIIETAGLLGSWGISQLPYLIPPDVTVESAANSQSVLEVLLIGTIIGMVLLLPSLYYLFSVFKLPYPAPGKEREAKNSSVKSV